MIIFSPPFRFAQASLLKGKQTEVIKHLKAFFSRENIDAGNDSRCLILSGPPGVGKTEGIYGLLNDRKILCRLLNDDELKIGVITPSFFSGYSCAPFEEKENILDEARCADILGMDDVGMETASERNVELLEMILDYRYSEMMTTIITTNLSSAAFKARYTERIIDRLREWGTFVEVPGISLRRNPDQEFSEYNDTDWDRTVEEMERERRQTLNQIQAMDDQTREKLSKATEQYLIGRRQQNGLMEYYGRISAAEVNRNMPDVAEKLHFFQEVMQKEAE